MKIVVETEDLLAALKMARQVVPGRSGVPIMNHILLEAGEGLTVTGSDLDIWVVQEIAGETEIAGSVAVEAAVLATFLQGRWARPSLR